MSKLKYLDLSGNAIAMVKNINLPDLESLDVSKNTIADFDGNLSKLTYLNLSDNNLTGIPRLKLPKLYNLDLSNNNIVYIDPEDILENFPNLDWLDISGNCIGAEEIKGLRKILKKNGISLTAKQMKQQTDPNAAAVATLAYEMKKGVRKRKPLHHQTNEETGRGEEEEDMCNLRGCLAKIDASSLV